MMSDEYEGTDYGGKEIRMMLWMSEDDAVDDGQKISCTVIGHGVDWR